MHWFCCGDICSHTCCRGNNLLLQFRDFAAQIGELIGLFGTGIFKICAQFSVSPQKVKRDEGGDGHEYQEEDR